MPRTELSDGFGTRIEYRNDAGEYHRENDLPAIKWNSGSKYWLINDRYHRIDNPAVIYSDGHLEWWLNGKLYSRSNYYPDLYLYKGIITNA